MSVLEFWDVFRMFAGELENRGYNNNQRQYALSQTVAALKDVLVQVEAEAQEPYPPQGYQQPYQPPPQQYNDPGSGYTSPRGYQQPPQQYQQQYQPPPQQYQPPPQQYQPPPQQYQPPPQQYQPPPQQAPPQQQFQPPPQQSPQGRQQAPPPQEEPEPSGGGGGDGSALASIATVVYGSGLKLNLVFKGINVDGDGCTPNQLADGLIKLGVRLPAGTITRLAAPYFTGAKMNYSGFVKLLAAGQS